MSIRYIEVRYIEVPLYMNKNLDVTKPLYSEQILSVPWPIVKSRFHCIPFSSIPFDYLFVCFNDQYGWRGQVLKKQRGQFNNIR